MFWHDVALSTFLHVVALYIFYTFVVAPYIFFKCCSFSPDTILHFVTSYIFYMLLAPLHIFTYSRVPHYIFLYVVAVPYIFLHVLAPFATYTVFTCSSSSPYIFLLIGSDLCSPLCSWDAVTWCSHPYIVLHVLASSLHITFIHVVIIFF